ncbi:helix-turn-helix domain-containing protein [Streptococcus equinus]|uniref:helix-turn-helix domain-containing protein n=1 Tax=Streptococcus equinus TaxID=1335 RepID=UPI0005F7CAF2|nr:helix-turn-helix domain-containing protein [Streptococcus equinus]
MLSVHIYDKEIEIRNRKVKILYNLSSSLEVNEHKLDMFDILLVNASDRLSVKQTEVEKMTYAIFYIDEMELARLFQDNQLLFACDSSQEKNDNFTPLRECLTKLLLANSEEDVFAKVSFQEYTYKLYLLLMNHFRISKLSLGNMSLAEKFEYYIAEHFQSDLSLAKISEDFFVTPQYFSKLFKETMGVTFYKYLTAIRLDFAKSQLLDSDKTILEIALDSGFANVNAFNRAYKERYQELPSDFKKVQTNPEVQHVKTDYQVLSQLLEGQIVEQKQDNQQSLLIDVSDRKSTNPYWQRVINIGDVTKFNQKRTEEQFLDFQSEMQFEYVRLKLNYSEEFNQHYSYFLEDSYMDFLVKLNLKFQFVIDFRDFENHSNYMSYLKCLLSHFSNRYSIERLRKWRFELDYVTIFDDQKCQSYASAYQIISLLLRHYKIEENLYGPGFTLGDISSFRLFMANVKNGIIPEIDHLTFHVLPQTTNKDNKDNIVFQTVTDVNYIKNQLEMVQTELDGAQCYYHIVEWRDYQPYHLWINDSIFKAASIIKNTLACLGMLEDLAWSVPLDSLLDCRNGGITFGGEGCVTQYGIKKPSFYAHSFLSRHGRDLLAFDDKSLVTSSGHNISIVSHNCSQLNYRYYSQTDDKQHYRYEDYFEKLENLNLTFDIRGMKEGTYLIKTRVVNSTSGSLQDLMANVFLDEVATFGDSEINYLKSKAIPSLTLSQVNVSNGNLSWQVDLQPNEICYSHIIYLY